MKLISNFKFQISNKEFSKYIIASILILLGILFRTVWHMGDNVEFVTAASLLSAAYLGLRFSIIVPFLIMLISDIFIGTTNIFLFTWSAYVIIAFGAYTAMKFKVQNEIKTIVKATGIGIIASVWFYLWTNFGVWALDSWGMYPKTLVGLIDAYIMGLPFLKSNMIGNLILVPASFGLYAMSEKIAIHFSRKSQKQRKAYV
jgi:hypothetical protein